MKKRILALVMALTLGMTMLAGCGSSASSNTETAAPAASGSEEAAPAAEAAGFEQRVITISCSTNEMETPSRVLKVFMDKVTELTGGAVTFQPYYGSTYCASTEELYQLQSGALDMCILQTLAYGDALPLLVSMPQMWVGTDEDAKNYFDTIFVKDETTSKLINDSMAQFNAVVVGNIYTGLNCYFSTKTFNSFEDLKGLKVGCQDSAPIDGLGLTAVFVDVGDYYDSLDRGVIDAGTFSFDGTVALKLYEPAKNVMLDKGKTWGMPFTIRKDLWESFSPELQDVFAQAMSAAQDYSVQAVNENIEAAKTNLGAEGVVIGELSDEDAAASFEAQLVASIANGMRRAEAAGVADQMLIIEKKCLELYGLDEAKYLADYQ